MEKQNSSLWVPLRPQIAPSYLFKSLKTLKNNYTFISLEHATEMIKGSLPLIKNAIVLTIDDGYKNSIKYGLPIFEYLKIPVTIFVSTNHIEKRIPFWFDRLDYALQQIQSDKMVEIAGKSYFLNVSNIANTKKIYKNIRDYVKSLKMNDFEMVSEFNFLSKQLEDESGKKIEDIFENDDWSSILSWDDIKNVDTELVDWGSHSVDHIRLNLINNDIAKKQVIESKRQIEKNTGKVCKHFCYPYGGYNDKIVSITKRSGYHAAVTVEEGTNKKYSNLFKLKRIPYPEKINNITFF